MPGLDLDDSANVRDPYTALTADLFRGLIDTAGDLDHSGLIAELERRNGIVA
jgi:hypothetical protein